MWLANNCILSPIVLAPCTVPDTQLKSRGTRTSSSEVFLKGFCSHFQLTRSVCRQVAVWDWELCCCDCTGHESEPADGFAAHHRLV